MYHQHRCLPVAESTVQKAFHFSHRLLRAQPAHVATPHSRLEWRRSCVAGSGLYCLAACDGPGASGRRLLAGACEDVARGAQLQRARGQERLVAS
jgi:hypothetical protein